jgi:tRNA dimethylallyltransferase
MQVYRGLDVGTAKPPRSDRAIVPHHLVDCADIGERFDASRFVAEATAAVTAIWNRRRTALLVGGTGLYARSLLYGLQFRPAFRQVAEQVQSEARSSVGLESLRLELSASDPEGKIPGDTYDNPRRLVRAVEVLRATGSLPDAPQDLGVGHSRLARDGKVHQFVMLPQREELRNRIRKRTRDMILNGWLDETRKLVAAGLLTSPTAYQALGYRDIATWLPLKDAGIDDLQRRICHKTWQYARRQMTWFRHQHPGACLLPLRKGVPAESVARGILATIGQDHADLPSSC